MPIGIVLGWIRRGEDLFGGLPDFLLGQWGNDGLIRIVDNDLREGRTESSTFSSFSIENLKDIPISQCIGKIRVHHTFPFVGGFFFDTNRFARNSNVTNSRTWTLFVEEIRRERSTQRIRRGFVDEIVDTNEQFLFFGVLVILSLLNRSRFIEIISHMNNACANITLCS